MYYTSALFKTEVNFFLYLFEKSLLLFFNDKYLNKILKIMNSLNSEVNRLYNLFCEKNKYFRPKNGMVSFVAHSLGINKIKKILFELTFSF